jgi:uncharacterized protein YutD
MLFEKKGKNYDTTVQSCNVDITMQLKELQEISDILGKALYIIGESTSWENARLNDINDKFKYIIGLYLTEAN